MLCATGCSDETTQPQDTSSTPRYEVYGEISLSGVTGILDSVGRGRTSNDSMRFIGTLPELLLMDQRMPDTVSSSDTTGEYNYYGKEWRQVSGNGENNIVLKLQVDSVVNGGRIAMLKIAREEKAFGAPWWEYRYLLVAKNILCTGSWDDTITADLAGASAAEAIDSLSVVRYEQQSSPKELNGYETRLVERQGMQPDGRLHIKLWRKRIW